MSTYREFTGKTVEEALRAARDEFGVGLDGLDFEILTPGARGVLGMGAEPARVLAAPRAALGGTAPKREAAEASPLPARPASDDRDRGDRGDRPPRREGGDRGFDRDRADRGDRADRPPRREGGERADRPAPAAPREGARPDRGERADRGPRREGGDRPPRRDDRGERSGDRGGRGGRSRDLTASEMAELSSGRASVASERADLEAAEASPETLAAAKAILEELMGHLGFDVDVTVETGATSRVNITGEGDEKDALGALIGRKGERLSALQHLVNLMLSKQLGEWTRVLVDVEDYRGRRERQLREIAERAAARVAETGTILQLEPMPALERRWVHIALRENPAVVTQSVGEEPNRRIVILPRPS